MLNCKFTIYKLQFNESWIFETYNLSSDGNHVPQPLICIVFQIVDYTNMVLIWSDGTISALQLNLSLNCKNQRVGFRRMLDLRKSFDMLFNFKHDYTRYFWPKNYSSSGKMHNLMLISLELLDFVHFTWFCISTVSKVWVWVLIFFFVKKNQWGWGMT